ncbi:uncharacterized protein NMK_2803, partial [Novimethylophilus kurashikiensis]
APNQTCTLTNAAQVARPADGICTIARSGTSYTADAADPDCAANTKTTVASPKVTNQDAGGKQEVTANSDGSTTITTNIYNYNNNTTTTTVINYDSSGKVTGVNGQTTQGIGTAGSTSSPAPAATDTSNLATHSDVNGVTSAINAAASTAHTDATDIKGKLNVDGTTGNGDQTYGQQAAHIPSTYVVDQINNTQSDETEGMFQEVANLLTPFIPTPGSCTPWTGQILTRSFSFNWCPYIEMIMQVIGWITALLSIFQVFRITTEE